MNTALSLALILAATAVVLVSLAALYRVGSDRSKRWLTGMPVDYAAEMRAFFAKHRKPKPEPVPVKRGRHSTANPKATYRATDFMLADNGEVVRRAEAAS